MADSFALNPFVRISRDGTVTITVNKSEMGQGVYTALTMLIAEELECRWSSVQVESAPVADVYSHTAFGTQMTGGSTSILSEWERMCKVGAQAREMLIQAAAGRWGVARMACRAGEGVVIGPEGRIADYGDLAEDAARMAVPPDVALKDRSTFRLVGKPTRRLDTPEKVNGSALFGIDVRLPGMLTAVIARSPVFGGRVKTFNTEKTKAIAGIRTVVEIPSGVAVVADSFWSANLGRRALQVEWDPAAVAGLSTTYMRRQYSNLAKTPGTTARRDGDPERILSEATRVLEAEYEVPYLAHAPMEPLNCTVDLRPDRCDIYVGTQAQGADRETAARIAGLKADQVRIHTTFLGGGFGRRANPQSDFVAEAVEVAKLVKAPVKVIWTREDDTKGGYYRPMMADRLAAALDERGNPTAWRHTIVGQSIMKGTPFEAFVEDGIDPTSVEGANDLPYDIPNILVNLHTTDNPVPVLWWRSVGHSHTAFVVESFIDEIAVSAGRDPYGFRRDLLARDDRRRSVLDLVAEKAGWGTALPEGRARGIAVHKSFESYVAQVAEVSVDQNGSVRVHRVVCAVDCGRVVNPATIEAQMEGAIVMGLSAALYGEILIKEGRAEQGNFNDYPILKITEMPLVEVHIVESNKAPGGVGEPGLPPIAPAVANAVFAATGVRIRHLPIRLPALATSP
jgi:isoquinoline 1-oxidoreductase subunit beta